MTTDRRRILPAHRVAPFPMADAQEAWLIRATPQILSHRAMECGASAVAELVKMNGGLVPEELVRRSGPPMREVGPVLRGIARVGDELTGDEARAALRGDQTFMELLESQVTSGALAAFFAHHLFRRYGSRVYHLSREAAQQARQMPVLPYVLPPGEEGARIEGAFVARFEVPMVDPPERADETPIETWGFYAFYKHGFSESERNFAARREPVIGMPAGEEHVPHKWCYTVVPVCVARPNGDGQGVTSGIPARMFLHSDDDEAAEQVWVGASAFVSDRTTAFDLDAHAPSLRRCFQLAQAILTRRHAILPYTPADAREARRVKAHRTFIARIDLARDGAATVERHRPQDCKLPETPPLPPAVAHQPIVQPAPARDPERIVIVPDHRGRRWTLERNCTTEEMLEAIDAAQVIERTGKDWLYGVLRPVKGWETKGTKPPLPKVYNVKKEKEVL